MNGAQADDGARRAALRAELADLAGDLRRTIEWAAETGAVELPVEPATNLPRLRRAPAPSRTVPAPAPPAALGHEPSPPAPRPSAVPVRPPASAPRPAVVPPGGGSAALHAVRAELGDCRRCRLCEGRTNLVFGVGDPSAKVVVIGEGPGYHEDRTGEPFVGRAGQLLTRMLASIGVRRDEAYICNVVKCRPPDNRDPQPDEVAACSPFLIRQVEAIAPSLLLTVGRFSSQVVCGLDMSIGRLRGTVRSWRDVPVVVTYHPAYLLRNPAAKRQAWEDLLLARKVLRGG